MNTLGIKILSLLLILSTATKANVRLPKLFADGMVLQRNQRIPVWGWAEAGEKVTVQFEKQVKNVTTDQSGKWKVALNPEPEGGPFKLIIKGENSITLSDVLMGDVWVCSGQSNMEFPVAISRNAKEEMKNANYPFIRQYNVPKTVSLQPKDDFNGGEWKAVNPQTVGSFTAVGYFFARELYNKLKIPIGLISANVGGTNIETWISRNAFEQSEVFNEMTNKVPTATVDELNKQQLNSLLKKIDSLQGSLPKLNEVAQWKEASYVDSGWKTMSVPGLWETKGWPKLDGVVWFRKEIFIDTADAGKSAILNLGSIDETDEAYVNGVKVGETKAKPVDDLKYTIPAGTLKKGKNIIAVRIEDTGGGGGFGGHAEKINLVIGETVIPLAGDWHYKIESVSDNGFAIYPNTYPTLLFNAMIHPLTPYGIKGVIWYQGESNTFRAYQYRTTFPLMIKDWRSQWRQHNFPFLFVQLPNFGKDNSKEQGSSWAELRESQTKALSLPNTGMAVTIDIGEGNNIHPKNKQEVGKRLADIALNKVYGKPVVYNGPVYNSYKIEGNKVIISFKHIGSGFLVKDNLHILKGFTIAGADKKFLDAKAYIKGNTVVVYSDKLSNPIAVRYAWADNPEEADLFNKEGLPAAPFRTDSWDAVTKDVVYQIGF